MRRKILVAAPFPPRRDGLHGGSQVIGRCLDELVETHSVAVIYLRAEGELPIESSLAERCAAVEEVPWRGTVPSLSRYCNLMWAWLRGYPMWVADWRVPAFRGRLREFIQKWDPDLVQFEYHVMAQYRVDAQERPAFLVQHEPGTPAAEERWRLNRGWRRPILAKDWKSWAAYEREIHQDFKAIVCFTPMDREQVLKLSPAARVAVIPPRGPSFPLVSQSVPAASGKNIVFAGNFGHPPNVDAAIWLASEILPRVLAKHPQAILQLVGDRPPASVRRLAGPHVEVTGRVPDVKPYLDGAAIIAAPLRFGGGIRIKVMDALAAGKALVCTRLAASGLDVTDGRNALLAETDEEFAAALSSILSNPELNEKLAQGARALAAQIAERGRVGVALEKLYSGLSG